MPLPLAKDGLRALFDVSAEKGGVGKTTIANRLRDHLRESESRVIMVRIESKRVLTTPAPDEIVIHSEDFADTGIRVGGVSGVLDPVYGAIEQIKVSGGAVVVDWGAGLTGLRLRMLAETGLDQLLAEDGITGVSVVVATREVDVMGQAARYLTSLRTAAPGLIPVLALNQLMGHFNITEETAGVQGKVFVETLMPAAQGLTTINLPRIGAEGWQPLQSAGLEMRDVLKIDPKVLAGRIGRSPLITRACISHVSDWWDVSRAELNKVLSSRDTERA
jgi:hypothetical protein